jgi:hypothetical protein
VDGEIKMGGTYEYSDKSQYELNDDDYNEDETEYEYSIDEEDDEELMD